MQPKFNDAFIGGLFGASLLGIMNDDSKVVNQIPIIKAVSLRFEPNIDLVKETIQETFFKIEREFKIRTNPKEFELKVVNTKNGWSERVEMLNLKGCQYNEFIKDAFLTVTIRSDGAPIPENIALLRNFVKKLKEKQINFEIW